MELTFPDRAVVVVAGLPGAGKSTLIRRAVDRDAVVVVDTDDARARGRGGRGLYLRHYLRIAGAVLGTRPTVIHTRGTRAPARRLIRLLAALRGRPAFLVLVDAPRAVAEAGQHERGRTVSQTTMDAEWRRWRRLLAGGVAGERWQGVEVLDRDGAAAIAAVAFAPTGAVAFAVT